MKEQSLAANHSSLAIDVLVDGENGHGRDADGRGSNGVTTPDVTPTPTPTCARVPMPIASWKTKRVRLNVGGTRHEVLWTTLERHPCTRLGRLASRQFDSLDDICDDYDLSKCEFFFDRHTDIFPTIVSFYRTGKLHLIGEQCLADLAEALEYWGLHENMLEPCCARRVLAFKDNQAVNVEDEDSEAGDETMFGTGRFAQYRLLLWRTLEQPTSSHVAKVWGIISIVFITVSTSMLVLGTTQFFQDLMNWLYQPARHSDCNSTTRITTTVAAASPLDDININIDLSANRSDTPNTANCNGTCYDHCDEEEETDHPLISGVEMICIMWFTLEFVLRFCASPNKLKFMKNTLNIIDLLGILPYFIAASISSYSHSLTSKFTTARKLLQLLRILRILRVFKIARHSTGLQALGYTVKQSYRELGMIVLFLVIGVLFFSTLCYYVEKDADDSKFTSIPEAFWYTAISMTTVGYGDITPVTPLGKLVGMICCLCGVLVIALPIPIIVSSFTEYLSRQRRVARVHKRAV